MDNQSRVHEERNQNKNGRLSYGWNHGCRSDNRVCIGINMKTAIVTGASSGIGKEFCHRLDAEGYDCIWLIARREEQLKKISDGLQTPSKIITCNLANRVDLERLKLIIETERPDVKMLVCCAGVGYFGTVTDVDYNEQHSMIDLNVSSLVDTISFTVPYMSAGSSIIVLCSLSAYIPMPYMAVYSSTKAFVRHYCNSIREELRPKQINVLEVSPGWVDTGFIDNCRDESVPDKVFNGMCTAEDVVDQALKDLSHKRKRSRVGIRTKFRSFMGLHFNTIITKIWMKYWK